MALIEIVEFQLKITRREDLKKMFVWNFGSSFSLSLGTGIVKKVFICIRKFPMNKQQTQ